MRSRRQRRIVADAIQPKDAGGHLLFVTDSLTWFWRCGRYSADRAHGLKVECVGQPGPGQMYRLKRLKKGRHPFTNAVLQGTAKRMLV